MARIPTAIQMAPSFMETAIRKSTSHPDRSRPLGYHQLPTTQLTDDPKSGWAKYTLPDVSFIANLVSVQSEFFLSIEKPSKRIGLAGRFEDTAAIDSAKDSINKEQSVHPQISRGRLSSREWDGLASTNRHERALDAAIALSRTNDISHLHIFYNNQSINFIPTSKVISPYRHFSMAGTSGWWQDMATLARVSTVDTPAKAATFATLHNQNQRMLLTSEDTRWSSQMPSCLFSIADRLPISLRPPDYFSNTERALYGTSYAPVEPISKPVHISL
ncbi:hypothetical protein V8B97DRAFT_1916007 [Scleroderma yunnanense]